jgi:hypothetical protein
MHTLNTAHLALFLLAAPWRIPAGGLAACHFRHESAATCPRSTCFGPPNADSSGVLHLFASLAMLFSLSLNICRLFVLLKNKFIK